MLTVKGFVRRSKSTYLDLRRCCHCSKSHIRHLIFSVEKISYVTDKPIPSVFRKLLDNRVKETKLFNESIENNSYFSLVLEAYYKSFFAGKLYITEKSLRPMRWKKPFIVGGP